MEISEDNKELSEFVSQIPSCFSSSGEVLYKSRNEIRMMETDGRWLVVKKFCNKGIIKQIIRSLGTSKGRRSFCNARYLLESGIPTPLPIAYIEKRSRLGLTTSSYYICEYSDMKAIADGLHEHDGFDKSMVKALADFIAAMHHKGILHNDLNSTNIIYDKHDCEYRFSLIDLNRMRVYKRRLTIFECLNDTTRFSYLSEMYIYFIRCYLHAMGWEDKLLDKAIRIKRRHDRAYSRRKAFFKKIKTLTKYMRLSI